MRLRTALSLCNSSMCIDSHRGQVTFLRIGLWPLRSVGAACSNVSLLLDSCLVRSRSKLEHRFGLGFRVWVKRLTDGYNDTASTNRHVSPQSA